MPQNTARKRLSILLLVTIVAAISLLLSKTPQQLPGVVQQDNQTYLIENNSTTYLVWHQQRARGKTLVHLDTHDDCRYLSDDKLNTLGKLTTDRRYQEIFDRSDITKMIQYELKEEDFIYDLGNFIYPCLLDGTVSKFYWVIPDKRLSPENSDRLQRHMRGILQLDVLPEFVDNGQQGFQFVFAEVPIILTTLDALPTQPDGALLDFDCDFFAFPNAMTDSHLADKLQWNPREVCEILSRKVPQPSIVTVCASVTGGYLPLIFRFVPDACYAFYTEGEYPSEADHYLTTAYALRRGETHIEPLSTPSSLAMTDSANYLNGAIHLVNGQEQKAYPLFQQASKRTYIYRRAYLDAAEGETRFGHYDRAHALLDRFETANKKPTMDSTRIRARLYLLEERLPEAQQLVTHMLAWNRDHLALNLQGNIRVQQNQVTNAIPLYREALTAFPGSADIHYNLGVALDKANDLEAVKHYQAALSLNPTMTLAYENLGSALLRWKRFAHALRVLETATKNDPTYASHWHNLGLAQLATHKRENARDSFIKSLGLDPSRLNTHLQLANLYAANAQNIQAIRKYATCLELQPDLLDAHRGLAYILAKSEQTVPALKHIEYCLRIAPRDPRNHYTHATILLAAKRIPEAISALKKNLALSETETATIALANAYISLGQTTKGIDQYQSAIIRHPEWQRVREGLEKLQSP